MIIDKGIPIRNVYYMLTYAFKELKHNNYEYIAGEDFNNIYELFAEILSKGISYLLKQGLHKEYVLKNDLISTLRGKLDLEGTIKEKISQKVKLACEYDELTINNLFNQIIKSSVLFLLNKEEVKKNQKYILRKLMLYFDIVDIISPSYITWKNLRYDRNTRTYQMLHSLCYFVLQNQLLCNQNGNVQMLKFSDEHMNLLFQRFVLEYYKQHYPKYKISAKQIKWNFTECDISSSNILPIMQSDITIEMDNRTLIIDTKYYSKIMQNHFNKSTIRSDNFYQIHTYVMNEDKEHLGKVDGMLLYAQTIDGITPYSNYKTRDGNILMARCLDLSQDFEKIKKGLDTILKYNFG